MDNSRNQKTGTITQARMGSERLPGKSLMKVGSKPLLTHIIENLKKSTKLSQVVLATTKKKDKPDIATNGGEHGLPNRNGS